MRRRSGLCLLNYFNVLFADYVTVDSGLSEFVHEDSSPFSIRNCFKKVKHQGSFVAAEES